MNSNGWDTVSCVYNIVLHAKEVVLKLDSLRSCKASFTYSHAQCCWCCRSLGEDNKHCISRDSLDGANGGETGRELQPATRKARLAYMCSLLTHSDGEENDFKKEHGSSHHEEGNTFHSDQRGCWRLSCTCCKYFYFLPGNLETSIV